LCIDGKEERQFLKLLARKDFSGLRVRRVSPVNRQNSSLAIKHGKTKNELKFVIYTSGY